MAYQIADSTGPGGMSAPSGDGVLPRRFPRSCSALGVPHLRREVVDAILTYSLNYTYIDGLLAWNTQRIGEVEVPHHPRETGRSGYSVGETPGTGLQPFYQFFAPAAAIGFAGRFFGGGRRTLGGIVLLVEIRV